MIFNLGKKKDQEALAGEDTAMDLMRRVAGREESEDSEMLCIILLPETQDVQELSTLYKSIQDSGLVNHLGVFRKRKGMWVEQAP